MMRSINRTKTRVITRRLGRCEGFTLVELLVAMVVMLVVLLAIYTVWFGLQRSYAFTDEDMRAQREARTALAEMVEFIRTARKPDLAVSDALDMVIVSADANSLVCWTDTDRDAGHDLELVRFRVDTAARTLYRDESQTGDIAFGDGSTVRLVGDWLSNDAALPLFSYTSLNGTALPTPVAQPMSISAVTINLRIDIQVGKSPIAHELSTVVQPRNLRQY